MPKPIGTVISTPDSPSSQKFRFVVDGKVKKSQFVKVSSGGKVISRVADMFKANRYFERAESVQQFEMNDLPTEKWDYMVAEAVPLGIFSSKGSSRPNHPVSPGDNVYNASKKTLKEFLGLDKDGLNIGELDIHNHAVKLNMTRLFQKHLAIVAQSGSGKSYLVKVMLEEILNREPDSGQVAAVVIDPHGEYKCFDVDKKFQNKTKVIKGENIRISLPHMSSGLLSGLFPDLSSVQRRELMKSMAGVRRARQGNVFGLKELVTQIKEDESMSPKTKNVLLSGLETANRMKLLDVSDNPSLSQLIKQGCLTVIDLSNVSSFRKRQIIVDFLSRKLFSARRKKMIPPYVLFVEEAHNFAPETAKKRNAVSKGVLIKHAREGRKFNACLCLVSQRPKYLSTTALSQCNTQIILRITNPYDLEHIGKSSEGLTKEVLSTISSLRTGEAVVVGEAVNFPIFLNVREKEVGDVEVGIPLEKEAKSYRTDKKKEDKDMDAFMPPKTERSGSKTG